MGGIRSTEANSPTAVRDMYQALGIVGEGFPAVLQEGEQAMEIVDSCLTQAERYYKETRKMMSDAHIDMTLLRSEVDVIEPDGSLRPVTERVTKLCSYCGVLYTNTWVTEQCVISDMAGTPDIPGLLNDAIKKMRESGKDNVLTGIEAFIRRVLGKVDVNNQIRYAIAIFKQATEGEGGQMGIVGGIVPTQAHRRALITTIQREIREVESLKGTAASKYKTGLEQLLKKYQQSDEKLDTEGRELVTACTTALDQFTIEVRRLVNPDDAQTEDVVEPEV